MIGERDRLITVASLVLGLSGVVLGLLSLVAILWLPAADEDVVQGSVAAPDVTQRGASSSQALSPMVGGAPESTPDGGDALKTAAPEAPTANDRPLRKRPPATPAGDSEPEAETVAGDGVSEGPGPYLLTAPDQSESAGPKRMSAAVPSGEVPGKDHEPVASQEASQKAAPRSPGEAQSTGLEPIATEEVSQVVAPESSDEASPISSGDTDAGRQGPAGHPAAAKRTGEAGSEEAPTVQASGPFENDKVSAANTDKAVPADASLRSSGWILDQEPGRYTIQIMAVKDLGQLRRFARQGKLGLKLAYYPVIRKGQRWYILIGGSFEGRKAAAQRLKKLPRVVRKNSPWIRSMESVQKEIRRS